MSPSLHFCPTWVASLSQPIVFDSSSSALLYSSNFTHHPSSLSMVTTHVITYPHLYIDCIYIQIWSLSLSPELPSDISLNLLPITIWVLLDITMQNIKTWFPPQHLFPQVFIMVNGNFTPPVVRIRALELSFIPSHPIHRPHLVHQQPIKSVFKDNWKPPSSHHPPLSTHCHLLDLSSHIGSFLPFMPKHSFSLELLWRWNTKALQEHVWRASS